VFCGKEFPIRKPKFSQPKLYYRKLARNKSCLIQNTSNSLGARVKSRIKAPFSPKPGITGKSSRTLEFR